MRQVLRSKHWSCVNSGVAWLIKVYYFINSSFKIFHCTYISGFIITFIAFNIAYTHSGWQSSSSLYYHTKLKHDSGTGKQGYPELHCCWQPHPQHSLVQGWQGNCWSSGHWEWLCDTRSNSRWKRILPMWSLQQLWESVKICRGRNLN